MKLNTLGNESARPARPRNAALFALAVGALLALGAGGASAAPGDRSADGAWTQVTREALHSRRAPGSIPWVQPDRCAAFDLNAGQLGLTLSRAPMEFTAAARAEGSRLEVSLPSPEGGYERFAVVESPVADPELYQWMADAGHPMKTYKVSSLDRPATTGRIDFGGPAGFHAMIQTPEGAYFVDPFWQGDERLHASYWRVDYPRSADDAFSCEVIGESLEPPILDESAARGALGSLRTYRLANAATGEYTTFHGGTVVAGQAAIVTAINRVNQIYERDLSVRLILVGNNSLLVYTNGGADPYSNGNGVAMLSENQSNCNAVIGSANYDIGHVFSTGGGGVASLGSVCGGAKAQGVTGQGSPIGDPFSIDYVAHEMGHQFGGNHTFNSTTGSCNGNRSGPTAYEPGSGATIQAYAGICGADNLQSNSDAVFHRVSLNEMLTFINGGGSCSGSVASGNNNAPTINAGANYTIPRSTPFELTPTASGDGDGDALTYMWEEFDLGPAASVASGDNGGSPIFRTWLPSSSPSRVFPRLSNLIANTTPFGETLPTTNRTMTFFATVRDNNAGGGLTGTDSMTVTSTTSSGPFVLTAPNGGETLMGATTVTWNVAGTTGAPVSAANVDILLSTDGGLTYPTTLATATPNDGSHSVVLPNIATSTARVRAQGSGNIFFDISNANFSIAPGSPEPQFEDADSTVADDSGAGANNNGSIDPGETIALTIGVENVGTQTATGVSATLASMTGTVSVTQANSTYPNLPLGGGAGINATPYQILVDLSHPCGDPIDLQLTVTSNEKTNAFTLQLNTGATSAMSLLNEGFEGGALPGTWSTSVPTGPNNWAARTGVSSAGTPSGGANLVSYEPPFSDVVNARLITPAVTGATDMTFFHSYDVEIDGDGVTAYDGLVIEVSTTGTGGPWTILDSEITGGGYNAMADGGFGSTLTAGQPCWSNENASFPAMQQVSVDLSAFTAQTINIAFRYAEDNCCSAGESGWFIDDVNISGVSISCAPFAGGMAPTADSIARQTPAAVLTNASSVSWRVQFSEPVTGVDATGPTFSNFSLNSGGLGGSPAITGVSAVGGAPSAQWDVTASGYAGEGTLALNLSNVGSIVSSGSGMGLSAAGIPLAGASYTLDLVAPSLSGLAVNTELTIDATFDEQMGAGVLSPASYALSGSGQGTLAANPNSVMQIARRGAERFGAPSAYRLTWLAGDMVNGGDITITATGANDSAGNPIGASNTITLVGAAVPVELSSISLE